MAPLTLLAAALSTLQASAFVAKSPGRPPVVRAAADMSCDCAVIGAGPAGSVVAWLLVGLAEQWTLGRFGIFDAYSQEGRFLRPFWVRHAR